MVRAWLSRAIFASFVGAGLASCTLLTGVGDLSVVDGLDADLAETSTTPRADTGPVVVKPPADSGRDVASPPPDEDADAPIPDASADVETCDPTGCLDVKAPFEVISFGPKGQACPAGFGPNTDLVEDPVVAANGCPCSCSVASQGTCPSTGPMTTTFDNTATVGVCGNAGGTTAAGCSDDGFLGPFGDLNEHAYTPPAGGPSGGSCNSSVGKDNSKLSVTDRRSCKLSAPKTCNGKVCAPTLDNPHKVCVAASGNVACPPGFPDKHTMGTGASFTCSNGTCGCAFNAGNCTGGKLNFYNNGTAAFCIGIPAMVVDVNGSCVPTVSNPPGQTFGSHRYVPNPPTGGSCSATGAAVATPSLTGPTTTICCP